jgi:hypothetical protein
MSLPDGLKFLAPGWWVIHALAVLLVYAYAYRRGRADERREQRVRAAAPPAA